MSVFARMFVFAGMLFVLAEMFVCTDGCANGRADVCFTRICACEDVCVVENSVLFCF
jgi:hypothetical protein